MNKLTAPSILSVSELNAQSKKTLETHFPQIWVEGEISNFVHARSGHWYFTLKDSQSQIRCAIFRFNNLKIRFKPENGLQVILRAKLTLFEPRGDYQLIGDHAELAGDGKLLREYEILKNKLSLAGLFSDQHKKKLPDYPQTIGIISSADGAAVHDILQVLQRRAPSIKLILYSSLVQGKLAAQQLSQALSLAIKDNQCDALIIGRGGGSLEDLYAFNDEQLAYAIYDCPIPIISAVGHEIDFTICDFVADIRAPTPSAAAEIISPDEQQWLQSLVIIETKLKQLINNNIKHKANELAWLKKQLKHPSSKLETIRQKLDEYNYRLEQLIHSELKSQTHKFELLKLNLNQFQPQHYLNREKDKLKNLQEQLITNINNRLLIENQLLVNNIQKLDTLSPLAIMSRGYAMVTDAKTDSLIKTKKQTKTDQLIKVHFAKDELLAKIMG